MPTCAVYDCVNSNREQSKLVGITFHRFPANKAMRKQWIHACKRADNFSVENARVCSAHFEEVDFVRDLKAELLHSKPRKILKGSSVPHIKIPSFTSESYSDDNGRRKRVEKRDAKKEIDSLLNENKSDHQENSDLFPLISEDNDLPEKNSSDIELLKKENESLRKINVQILDEIRKLKLENAHLNEIVKKYESQFSVSQQKVLLKGSCVWTNDDISKAITLKCISKKAFKFIREDLKYPLPSEATLKRRLQQYIVKPGLIDLSMNVLKTQGNVFAPMEKDIIISFDEMKVKTDMCYNPILNKIQGPHSYVQIVMIRGVIGKWKQPIFYDFDKPVDKKLLLNIVKNIELASFRVRAFVCDMGPSNQKLLSELGINENCTKIKNPYCETRNIWAFHDVPHLLKLLRNHLLDKGYDLPGGKTVEKEIFQKLIEKQKVGDLKFTYKINNDHLLLTNMERQNVRKAAELISGTVATAIEYILPGNDHVADFIRIVNNGFDVLNSRIPYHSSKILKSAYGINIKEQDAALKQFYELCQSVRVKGKKNILPFQKGFLISISSLQGLYSELKTEGYTYIMSARCNQDILESFFSFIRGFGRFYDHPLPTAVSQRIKFSLMSRSSKTVIVSGNCSEEETDTLSADIIQNLESEHFEQTASILDDQRLEDEEDESILNIYETDKNDQSNEISTHTHSTKENPELIKVLAGYVAYRIKKKNIATVFNYGNPTNEFPTTNKDWLSSISRGFLMQPTNEWLQTVFKMEDEFNKFHGDDLKKDCGVMNTLSSILKNSFPYIDDFAILCFVRTRTFIRMKSLNKQKSQKRVHYEFKHCDNSRKKSKKLSKLL